MSLNVNKKGAKFKVNNRDLNQVPSTCSLFQGYPHITVTQGCLWTKLSFSPCSPFSPFSSPFSSLTPPPHIFFIHSRMIFILTGLPLNHNIGTDLKRRGSKCLWLCGTVLGTRYMPGSLLSALHASSLYMHNLSFFPSSTMS